MEARDKYEACVKALREFAVAAGFTDAVIGLSGGLDSSVVAVMSADAFGVEHVHGVLLPGPYSSSHSVADAQALADNLGIDVRIVPIGEPYDAFARVLGEACGGKLAGLAAENTQARCRMVCLMALSNAFGWMLVNTGNKSEACMGYSTLYGDTAGAFAPVGGLYKTDVYAVGRWRNDEAARAGAVPPIPESVFVKPPSAELSEGQSDEASMGISYSALDPLLIELVEHGRTPEEAARLCGCEEEEEARRIAARVSSYAFKRALEPPFPGRDFYA